MTNREAYLQELNELAATVVMGWRRVPTGMPIWADANGEWESTVARWYPCQNETQARMLADRVCEGANADMRARWAFRMAYDVIFWGADFISYSEETASWVAMCRLVAITRATIAESGGELPEHIEEDDDQA